MTIGPINRYRFDDNYYILNQVSGETQKEHQTLQLVKATIDKWFEVAAKQGILGNYSIDTIYSINMYKNQTAVDFFNSKHGAWFTNPALVSTRRQLVRDHITRHVKAFIDDKAKDEEV